MQCRSKAHLIYTSCYFYSRKTECQSIFLLVGHPKGFVYKKSISPKFSLFFFFKSIYFFFTYILKETMYLPARSWILSILCGPLSASQNSRSLILVFVSWQRPLILMKVHKVGQWAWTIWDGVKCNPSLCPRLPHLVLLCFWSFGIVRRWTELLTLSVHSPKELQGSEY